jgi:hypothetical protein
VSDLVKTFLIVDAHENPDLLPIVAAQRAGDFEAVISRLTEVFLQADIFLREFDLRVQALPNIGNLQDDEDEHEPEPPVVVVALDWMCRDQAEKLAELITGKSRTASRSQSISPSRQRTPGAQAKQLRRCSVCWTMHSA